MIGGFFFSCIRFIFGIFTLNTISIELWISRPSNYVFLTRSNDLTFSQSSSEPLVYMINVNEGVKFQQIDGFGATFTDASSWLLNYHLSPSKRLDVFRKLFTCSGINLSILKLPMGSSDYSWSQWTFDDTANNIDDFNLTSFSLWREDAYFRPVLNQILSINPSRLKFFASPWSPPAWMRTQKSLIGDKGGSLRPECYESYAEYFVRYIKDYERSAWPIYAVTIQNEPLNAPSQYPGMLMSPEEQINFTLNSLVPKLKVCGIDTRIIIGDDKLDDAGLNYAQIVLNNTDLRGCVSGASFHSNDSSDYSSLAKIHEVFGKDIWITEIAHGPRKNNATLQFQEEMYHLIRGPRNWAKGLIFKNLALDQNAAPKLVGVDASNQNRGLVMIRSDTTDSVIYETGYFSIGHTSKFVNPGAYRIESTSWTDDLETVAYLNLDNSIVLVISNRSNERKEVKITWRNYEARFAMDGMSAASLKWNSF